MSDGGKRGVGYASDCMLYQRRLCLILHFSASIYASAPDLLSILRTSIPYNTNILLYVKCNNYCFYFSHSLPLHEFATCSVHRYPLLLSLVCDTYEILGHRPGSRFIA